MKNTAPLLAATLALVGCQPATVVSVPVAPPAHQRSQQICAACVACPPPGARPSLPAVEVHFSPLGSGMGCTEAVVSLIDEAHANIRVQSHAFSSTPILSALSRARVRGVDVALVLDRSEEGKTWVVRLPATGARVFIDKQHAIQHSKVLIVDGAAVETGSFQFTRASEDDDAENCIVLRSPEVAATYASEWETHRAHSTQLP